jgi:3-hydroxybutyryl-CoA dehydratase
LRRSAEIITPCIVISGLPRQNISIECDFTITELDERNRATAEAVFTNQQEEIVIEAHLTGILPGVPEKRVMEVMLAEGDPTNKCP